MSLALSSSGARVMAGDPALRDRDERLESLKVVAGKMAHDFNNFLVPFLGYVTLIREETAAESITIQYLDAMMAAAGKSEGLLESILLSTRPQRIFNPREFNFSAMLTDSISQWEKTLPETAQIAQKVSVAENCTINGDERHWSNVVAQLLSNVRYALATGGEMRIELSAMELSNAEQARLGIWTNTGLKLTISDGGFGMDSEVKRRAFEPFFTTREQAKATGLGLTIVHSVAHLHGGQVELDSSRNQGTTITLWIPYVAIGRLKPSTKMPIAKSLRQGKILLVEDDPVVREVIKDTLQQTRREIYVAKDGSEALALFRRHSPGWELVVTDLVMPKLGGFDLFQAIREQDKTVRFILLTGDPAQAGQFEGMARDTNRPLMIQKPFTLGAFNEVVKTHLESVPY